MDLLLAVLGGVVAGMVLQRFEKEIPTRLIFNAVILAIVVAQTVFFFTKTEVVLSAQALLAVILVLWGMDMTVSGLRKNSF